MEEKFGTAQIPDLTHTDPSVAAALLKWLNMNPISPFFDYCCEQAAKSSEIPFWLTESYVRETAAELPCLKENLEIVVSAIGPLMQNADLVLFAKTLYRMLAVRRRHEIVF